MTGTDARSFETQAFAASFQELLLWRRDVRHFRPDAVPAAVIQRLIGSAMLAPSVGLSPPWRFMLVETAARRASIVEEFAACNARAADIYADARAAQYRALKLEGLSEAPVHLAASMVEDVATGHGLRRQTQPQTLRDSVVCAIHALWLVARIEGLGVGWVSILRPKKVHRILDLPPGWAFVAYLVIGWPQESSDQAELLRLGWEKRQDPADCVVLG